MSKSHIFLWLIVSSIFALVTNVIASGLEQKYQLVNNQTRWIIVLGVFAVSFILLIWLEYQRNQVKGNSSINKLLTRFGTKTGSVTVKSKGAPPEANTNIVELGPMTQTRDIEIDYDNNETD